MRANHVFILTLSKEICFKKQVHYITILLIFSDSKFKRNDNLKVNSFMFFLMLITGINLTKAIENIGLVRFFLGNKVNNPGS